MDEKPILLTVITPGGEPVRARCDSVRLNVPDSRDGKIKGGSVGIRRGHTDALMALAPGKVEGFSDGKRVLCCEIGGGLAVVSGDQMNVLARRSGEE